MGRAYILVSHILIADALQMPKDVEIYGCQWRFEDSSIKLFISSPELPENQEGAVIPKVNPTITESLDERVEWSWNGDSERA